jgi:hypothetical protein
MKIGRAYKHLQEFDSLVVKHCRDPYSITQRDDLANERYIVRWEFKVLDADIYLSLSDLVYSSRSGLDQLAWQLSLLGNPNPGRDVMFPIHPDRSTQSEERFRKRVWDMPCEAVAIIKELQPYNKGTTYRDDPLWQLNELSNIDKHRVPAGRAIDGGFDVQPSGWSRSDFDNGTNGIEISWSLSVKDSVVFKPKIPKLVFGDPINLATASPLELTREEVIRIYNYVREDVAPKFSRFFPPSRSA